MKPNNYRLFGYERDLCILDSVILFKFLAVSHVADLHFAELKPGSRERKTNARLKALTDSGKLARFREEVSQGFIYHIPGKRSNHADSYLYQASFFVEVIKNSKEWQGFESIEIEQKIDFSDGSFMIADAYCKYKLGPDRVAEFYLETEFSRNDLTKKFENYKKLSRSKGLTEANKVLVVILTRKKMKKRILEIVSGFKSSAVKFNVVSLEDVKTHYLAWYTVGQGLADGFMDAEKERGRVEVSSKITGEVNRKADPQGRAEGYGGSAGQRPGAVASNMPTGLQRPKVSIQGRRD
jgi:hypothetical protein